MDDTIRQAIHDFREYLQRRQYATHTMASLQGAAASGHTDIVKVLLAAGADVNTRNISNNWTLAFFAVLRWLTQKALQDRKIIAQFGCLLAADVPPTVYGTSAVILRS